MDEWVRAETAKMVREMLKGAFEDKVVQLHPNAPPPPPPRRRRRTPLLCALAAAPILALVPLGEPADPAPEPVRVSAYVPYVDTRTGKFELAGCDPSRHAVEVLIGGRPEPRPEWGERDRLPVY